MTRVTTLDIIRSASAVTTYPRAEIVGPRKSHVLVDIRAAIAICARRRGKSMPEIGRALGGRDHSTVFNYLRCHDGRQEVLSLVKQIEAHVASCVPWHCRPVRFEAAHA